MESQLPFSFASQWHSPSKLTETKTKWLIKSCDFRKLFFLPSLSQLLSPIPVPKGHTVTLALSPFRSPLMLNNNSKSCCALSHWFDIHQQGWIKSVVIIAWTKSGGEERTLWRSKIPECCFVTIPSILHGWMCLSLASHPKVSLKVEALHQNVSKEQSRNPRLSPPNSTSPFHDGEKPPCWIFLFIHSYPHRFSWIQLHGSLLKL